MTPVADVWVTISSPAVGKGKTLNTDVALWIGGMLFSLPTFAVKVGIGLGRGSLGRRPMLLTYGMYFALFIGAACLAPMLTGVLDRVMKAGPCLPALAGTIMIAWGILAIRWLDHVVERPVVSKRAWILVMPCPACLIAAIVSTGVAMELVHLPALAAGTALGAAFVALGCLLQRFVRSPRGGTLAQTCQVAMALAMLVIGAYLLATMFLPAVIRDAGQVYASFIVDGAETGTASRPGVWLMLAAVAALGYFARGRSAMRS